MSIFLDFLYNFLLPNQFGLFKYFLVEIWLILIPLDLFLEHVFDRVKVVALLTRHIGHCAQLGQMYFVDWRVVILRITDCFGSQVVFNLAFDFTLNIAIFCVLWFQLHLFQIYNLAQSVIYQVNSISLLESWWLVLAPSFVDFPVKRLDHSLWVTRDCATGTSFQ